MFIAAKFVFPKLTGSLSIAVSSSWEDSDFAFSNGLEYLSFGGFFSFKLNITVFLGADPIYFLPSLLLIKVFTSIVFRIGLLLKTDFLNVFWTILWCSNWFNSFCWETLEIGDLPLVPEFLDGVITLLYGSFLSKTERGDSDFLEEVIRRSVLWESLKRLEFIPPNCLFDEPDVEATFFEEERSDWGIFIFLYLSWLLFLIIKVKL